MDGYERQADSSDRGPRQSLRSSDADERAYVDFPASLDSHCLCRTQALKDLAQSYGSIVSDGTRVKNRLKASFRGRGIPCRGTSVYDKKERERWLKQLDNASLRARACRIFAVLQKELRRALTI